MSSQIKKKFIEANAVDGSKIQIQNDEALRIKKQGGSDQEVFKLDTTDKLQFLISPRMAFDPVDSDELARKGYVDQKISDLIDGAPALLDTLNELAAAIGDDENFATTFTNAVANLQSQIDSISGAGLGAIQSELDATQVGAGLETNGAYSAPVGSNYLGMASSLKDADSKLDTQLKVVADGLAQEILDRIADVDAEESARIAEDLTMVKLDGSRAMTGNLNMGGNSISSVIGVSGDNLDINATVGTLQIGAAQDVNIVATGADLTLESTGSNVVVSANGGGGTVFVDAASLDMMSHDIINALSVSTTDGAGNEGYLDSLELNILDTNTSEQVVLTKGSLEATGSFFVNSTGGDVSVQALSGTVHIAASTGEIEMGGAKLTNVAAGVLSSDAATFGQVSSVQSELDATQVGAGLGTDGSYSAPVGSNYLGMASSLKDADSKLDAQVKVVADGLAQEILDRAADVDSEESRAMAAESLIAGNLAQEILDRAADVDAEESRAMAAEGALQGLVDALEAVSVEFVQQKFVLSATDISNGYVTLSNLAYSASINAFVDRLAIHETDDYTVSTVSGATRITFAGSLITAGQEKLSAGDVVRVKYAKVAIV